MARPRKSERGTADIRLANAFWALLEHHRLANTTVGMVAEQAELNRGTFYYHFKSMDDLIDRAIKDEVLGNGSILQNMLSLVAGSSTANGFEAFIKHDMERIALLIKQGGMDSFSIKVKRLMFGAWKAILCDEGKEISPSASRPVTSTSSPAETRQTRVHRHRLKTVRHHFIAVMRSEEALHGADGLGAGQTVHPAIECRERHNRIHQEKRQQSPG